jgi:hypothetical protein
MPDTHHSSSAYPSNVVIPLSHDARFVHAHVRDPFVLDDSELDEEIIQITDPHAGELFDGSLQGTPLAASLISQKRFGKSMVEGVGSPGITSILIKC